MRAVRHQLHLEPGPGDGGGAGVVQHGDHLASTVQYSTVQYSTVQHRHHLSAHHQLVPYTLGSEQ